MPKRYRYRDFAAGLGASFLACCVFGGFLFGLSFGSDAEVRQEARTHAAEYAQRADVAIKSECSVIAPASRAACTMEKHQALREQERYEYDLEAQQTMAIWTKAMGVAAIIGMMVGLVGLGLIYVTFQQTRRAANAGFDANKIARDSSECQLRAYVGFKWIGFAEKDGGHAFSVTAWNAGNTPAYDFRMLVAPHPIIDGTSLLAAKFHFAKKNQITVRSKTILYPGQEAIMTSPVNLKDGRIRYLEDGRLGFLFGGVASYRDAFGKLHRATFKHFLDYSNSKKGIGLNACARGNNAN